MNDVEIDNKDVFFGNAKFLRCYMSAIQKIEDKKSKYNYVKIHVVQHKRTGVYVDFGSPIDWDQETVYQVVEGISAVSTLKFDLNGKQLIEHGL